MRKFGLIGGMSWVSTRMYYEWINKGVTRRVGPMASAPLLIESLDFKELSGLTNDDEWDRAADILVASAKRLEEAGAGALAIAANSMHRVYDQVAEAVDVPVLHIAEAVGDIVEAAPNAIRLQKRLCNGWEPPGVDAAIIDSLAKFAQAYETGEPRQYCERFFSRRSANPKS